MSDGGTARHYSSPSSSHQEGPGARNRHRLGKSPRPQSPSLYLLALITNQRLQARLFTVLYFPVRSSRWSAFSRPPYPRAIIPDARPLATFENQDGRH